MLKVIFIVVLGLTFTACGARSRNQSSTSAAVDDNSEVEQNAKVVSDINASDLKDFGQSTVKGCENAIDKRLTVGSKITQEKHEKFLGQKVKYTDVYTITGLDENRSGVQMSDLTTFNRAHMTSSIDCKVSTAISPRLICRRAGNTEEDLFTPENPKVVTHSAKEMEVPMALARCQVSHASKPDIHGQNILYALKKGAEPTLAAQRITTVYNDSLNCDGKDMGKGSEVEVKIYASEVPSIDQTSCGVSIVYRSLEYRDAKSKVVQRKVKKVVDVSLASSGI
jgi:hypothetical protein